MAALTVQLVAADRLVWEGEASQVSARTTSGDLGILPGHTPLLGILAASEVRIKADGTWRAATLDGGFLSVEQDRVTIVADSVDATDMVG